MKNETRLEKNNYAIFKLIIMKIFRFANYTFFTFVIAYNLSILAGFMVIEAAILVLGEWRVSFFLNCIHSSKVFNMLYLIDFY